MKKIAFLFFFAMTALTITSFSQAKKSIDKKVMSKAYSASRGAQDPNIKSGVPTVDKKVDKSRGADDCMIYFDNYSGLYVEVYVSGYYMGTMSGYGSMTVRAGGYTTIYCKSTGGTRYWSDSGDCSGNYHFKLY